MPVIVGVERSLKSAAQKSNLINELFLVKKGCFYVQLLALIANFCYLLFAIVGRKYH